jgi:hypothetical protein
MLHDGGCLVVSALHMILILAEGMAPFRAAIWPQI